MNGKTPVGSGSPASCLFSMPSKMNFINFSTHGSHTWRCWNGKFLIASSRSTSDASMRVPFALQRNTLQCQHKHQRRNNPPKSLEARRSEWGREDGPERMNHLSEGNKTSWLTVHNCVMSWYTLLSRSFSGSAASILCILVLSSPRVAELFRLGACKAAGVPSDGGARNSSILIFIVSGSIIARVGNKKHNFSISQFHKLQNSRQPLEAVPEKLACGKMRFYLA